MDDLYQELLHCVAETQGYMKCLAMKAGEPGKRLHELTREQKNLATALYADACGWRDDTAPLLLRVEALELALVTVLADFERVNAEAAMATASRLPYPVAGIVAEMRQEVVA